MDAPRGSLRPTTSDGWRLNLACYPAWAVAGVAAGAAAGAEAIPSAPAAMLLSPGMMLDGRAMDRPPGRGLASFFQARGYAVYCLDLRGHGASGPAASRQVDWNFDDLVLADVPAAVAAVKARHPDLPVVWLGHSLSAHAGAVALGVRPELPIDLLVLMCPGPWVRAFEPSWPVWLAKRGVLRLWDGVAGVCGRFPARRLGIGTDDESRGYVRQHRAWGASGRWESRDGSVDYLAALARIRRPALVVAAGGDLLCRARSVACFAAAIGDPAAGGAELWTVTGRDLGRRLPPAHMEMITAAPSLPIWERIDAWLRERLRESGAGGHRAERQRLEESESRSETSRRPAAARGRLRGS